MTKLPWFTCAAYTCINKKWDDTTKIEMEKMKLTKVRQVWKVKDLHTPVRVDWPGG